MTVLSLDGKRPGEPCRPLETVGIRCSRAGGKISLRDGEGREYFAAPTAELLDAVIGGSAGTQCAVWTSPDGTETEQIAFPVQARTRIDDAGGRFAELLTILHATMLDFGEAHMTLWNGRIYRFFVCWLRDHVHTLKGMKYFHHELKSAIELYRDSQREDGMIWDNVHPRTPEPDAWDDRFRYGDFIRPYPDGTGEFKRIPVENDVEYLFVEGVYFTWKAVGDDAWMEGCLDAAAAALDYSVNDPGRWSRRFDLLKRGYTIDTWDFQNEEDARISAGNDPRSLAFGDAMAIRPGHTRFGIMFGDNTGYAMACEYLAEMLEHAGRYETGEMYRARAVRIRQRLQEVAWNGRFYTHHVPEPPAPERDFGVDTESQVSLSNAYSLNRGIPPENAVEIIETYRRIRDSLPPGAPGEWYTIFPPFEHGFDRHCPKWQYMNGGVTPIVAGELARGAFEHGFEAYGATVLARLLDLARKSGNRLRCCYTGAREPQAEPTFMTLDIAGKANTDFRGRASNKVAGWTGEGDNDLRDMPTGKQKLAGINFRIPDPETNGRRGCIGLALDPPYTPRVEIPVDAKADAVCFLHTVSNLRGTVAGTVTLEYADGTRAVRHVLKGQHVSGWWYPAAPDPARTAVAWRGRNPVCSNVGLTAWLMENPDPRNSIRRIVLEATPEGGLWLLPAITLVRGQTRFEPGPVSFGIPDNWGAAAVVYALVEGLAGVHDEGTAFNRVRVAPRWCAAEVNEVAAVVTYPASNGYVAYRFRHDPAAGTATLELTGNATRARVEILLPENAAEVAGTRLDGQPLPTQTHRRQSSLYAVVETDISRPRRIEVHYA